MENFKIGDKLQMQCYKHNKKINCAWDEAVLLDIQKDYLVFGNNKTLVTEENGSKWRTKEPSILYFFKEEWFNMIVQLKKTGIFYYCNIATPFIIEDNTIKFIDYDLDLRIFPNGKFKILDRREFEYHKKIMKYDQKLEKAIKLGMDRLIQKYKNNEKMFDSTVNLNYYQKYLELVKKSI